jgi:hypothetical protein
MFCRTSTIRGCKLTLLDLGDFERRQRQLPAAHDLRRDLIADGAAKVLKARQRTLFLAILTKNHDRDVLNFKACAVERRSRGGEIEGEEERVSFDSGERAQVHSQGVDAAIPQALGLFRSHLDQAEGDGKLVHEERIQEVKAVPSNRNESCSLGWGDEHDLEGRRDGGAGI